MRKRRHRLLAQLGSEGVGSEGVGAFGVRALGGTLGDLRRLGYGVGVGALSRACPKTPKDFGLRALQGTCGDAARRAWGGGLDTAGRLELLWILGVFIRRVWLENR